MDMALLTTKRVELINKKEFAKIALDKNFKTFVVHITFLNLAPKIQPNKEAQIAFLLTKKFKILDEYLDFANIFSKKKILVLPESTKLKKYAINLKDGKQPRYGPIYSLGPVELEILKIYIETYLKTGFIQPFKSPAGALILFDNKIDGTHYLCDDYQDLNNLTIKNRYPLPLIGKSFN